MVPQVPFEKPILRKNDINRKNQNKYKPLVICFCFIHFSSKSGSWIIQDDENSNLKSQPI